MWCTVCVLPVIVALIMGVIVFYISDDAPKESYYKMQQNGTMQQVSYVRSFLHGAGNFNMWCLVIQYACCFGVKLMMNNVVVMYVRRDDFGQSPESIAAIASIFDTVLSHQRLQLCD